MFGQRQSEFGETPKPEEGWMNIGLCHLPVGASWESYKMD